MNGRKGIARTAVVANGRVVYYTGMSFSERLESAGVTATRFSKLTGFDKRTVIRWCNSLEGVPSRVDDLVRIQLEKIEAGEAPPTVQDAHQYQSGNVAGVWRWNSSRSR